jgi:hypothetical protein
MIPMLASIADGPYDGPYAKYIKAHKEHEEHVEKHAWRHINTHPTRKRRNECKGSKSF